MSCETQCVMFLLACGGIFTSLTGSFSSPGYPNSNYSNNAHCRYEIWVPSDRRIVLTLDYVELDQGYDKLVVKQLVSGYLSYVAVLTGSKNTNRRFISEEHVFVLLFESDGFGTARGFRARYHTMQLGKLYQTVIYPPEGRTIPLADCFNPLTTAELCRKA